MHIKKNDKVIVMAGKDKGKSGKILRVLPKKDKVIIAGINMTKKHQKAKSQEQKGGIIEMEMPIHVSNVRLEVRKSKKKTVNKASAKGGSA